MAENYGWSRRWLNGPADTSPATLDFYCERCRHRLLDLLNSRTAVHSHPTHDTTISAVPQELGTCMFASPAAQPWSQPIAPFLYAACNARRRGSNVHCRSDNGCPQLLCAACSQVLCFALHGGVHRSGCRREALAKREASCGPRWCARGSAVKPSASVMAAPVATPPTRPSAAWSLRRDGPSRALCVFPRRPAHLAESPHTGCATPWPFARAARLPPRLRSIRRPRTRHQAWPGPSATCVVDRCSRALCALPRRAKDIGESAMTEPPLSWPLAHMAQAPQRGTWTAPARTRCCGRWRPVADRAICQGAGMAAELLAAVHWHRTQPWHG